MVKPSVYDLINCPSPMLSAKEFREKRHEYFVGFWETGTIPSRNKDNFTMTGIEVIEGLPYTFDYRYDDSGLLHTKDWKFPPVFVEKTKIEKLFQIMGTRDAAIAQRREIVKATKQKKFLQEFLKWKQEESRVHEFSQNASCKLRIRLKTEFRLPNNTFGREVPIPSEELQFDFYFVIGTEIIRGGSAEAIARLRAKT